MPRPQPAAPGDLRTLSPASILLLTLALTGLLLLSGCGMPHDPEGTTRRARGGTIRAGITDNDPWTRYRDGEASGIEADLLEEFAEGLDAEVEWTHDAEGDLLELLHRGELDVVVGGLTDSTPWSKQVGLTQWYVRHEGEKHVLAAPNGENRWLLELDRFLQERRPRVERRLAAEVGR